MICTYNSLNKYFNLYLFEFSIAFTQKDYKNVTIILIGNKIQYVKLNNLPRLCKFYTNPVHMVRDILQLWVIGWECSIPPHKLPTCKIRHWGSVLLSALFCKVVWSFICVIKNLTRKQEKSNPWFWYFFPLQSMPFNVNTANSK